MTSPSPVSGWEAEHERLRKALERCETLLTAASAILSACDQAQFMDVRYDDAECDGACLLGDIDNHLEDVRTALSESMEQPTEDGWIEWKGGEMDQPPVEGKWVEVRLRDGTFEAQRSDTFDWRHLSHDAGQDILAFRVVQS